MALPKKTKKAKERKWNVNCAACGKPVAEGSTHPFCGKPQRPTITFGADGHAELTYNLVRRERAAAISLLAMAVSVANAAARLEERGWRVSLQDPKLAKMTGFVDFKDRALLTNVDEDPALVGLILSVEDDLLALGQQGTCFYTVDPAKDVWVRTNWFL